MFECLDSEQCGSYREKYTRIQSSTLNLKLKGISVELNTHPGIRLHRCSPCQAYFKKKNTPFLVLIMKMIFFRRQKCAQLILIENICASICKYVQPGVMRWEVSPSTNSAGPCAVSAISMTELRDVFLRVTLRPQTVALHVLMSVKKKRKKERKKSPNKTHLSADCRMWAACWNTVYVEFFFFFFFYMWVNVE